jgi:hypothetical protein
MRELWWMACGRIDLEIDGRVWWLGRVFGTQVPDEVRDEMHPLRRLEKEPPTPEQEKAAEGMAWTILEKGLAHLNQHRKG